MLWILAVLAVAAALAMILVPRAVHCALMLAAVMLCLATMYAMQGAPFLAFVQIIVYTGAVLMLFLFVPMLIGISSADSIVETIKGQRQAAGLAAIGLFALLTLGIGHGGHQSGHAVGRGGRPGQPARHRHLDLHHLRVPVRGLRRAADHRGGSGPAWCWRIASAPAPRPTQRQLVTRQQASASGHLAPDLSPGVYALHDSADRALPLLPGRHDLRGVGQSRRCRHVTRTRHHRSCSARRNAPRSPRKAANGSPPSPGRPTDL